MRLDRPWVVLAVCCGVDALLRPAARSLSAPLRGRSDDGAARMPTDEGAVSAHEFARGLEMDRRARDAALPEDDGGLAAVMRRGATEPAGSSGLPGGLDFELEAAHGTRYPSAGAYRCAGCGAALYWARQKIGVGPGWPAFYDAVAGAVDETAEGDGGGVALSCASCGGHLGHVFCGEGFGTPTDARHCVNGVCLRYDGAAEGQPESAARVFHLTLGGIPP